MVLQVASDSGLGRSLPARVASIRVSVVNRAGMVRTELAVSIGSVASQGLVFSSLIVPYCRRMGLPEVGRCGPLGGHQGTGHAPVDELSLRESAAVGCVKSVQSLCY